MIIERKEIEKINSIKAWTLVFGRRKTGKTFLVRNFVKWNDYFFVKRDGTILTEKEGTTSYDAFITILKRGIEEEKTAVVDEFHRLPAEFLDFLHYTEKKGRVILISSTLFLSRKLFSKHSPLLGLLAEMPIPILNLEDTLKAVRRKDIKPKEKLELAILLREPITIQFLTKEKAREIMGRVISFSKKSIPALVGEIFSEEERTLSAIYEGILRAVADGKVVSSGMSSYLFSRKLITKDDPSLIQQHLLNLVKLGILKRIQIFNKNRFIYKHSSPLVRLFYLADEKYNISERELSEKELREIIDKNFPKLVEDNVREILAKKFGLIEATAEGKDFEVDACLLEFKKLEVAVEVKWKNQFKKEDILKAKKNLEQLKPKRRILFVPDKKQVLKFKKERKGIEVMDVGDL